MAFSTFRGLNELCAQRVENRQPGGSVARPCGLEVICRRSAARVPPATDSCSFLIQAPDSPMARRPNTLRQELPNHLSKEKFAAAVANADRKPDSANRDEE
jgi:hypothetical protein